VLESRRSDVHLPQVERLAANREVDMILQQCTVLGKGKEYYTP